MVKRPNTPLSDAELHRLAEQRLRQAPPVAGGAQAWPANQEEARKLVHELQVHQIELEMQNAELIEARTQTEAALARYTDLYDFAPVGYFTLNPAGEIIEVNLTGARLLGRPRSEVTGRRFALFVTASSTAAFEALLARLFDDGAEGPFEATLELVADAPKLVRVEALASEDGRTGRAMVTDITQQQLAEQALRKFSRVIEQTASAIVITDIDGVIEYANPNFFESSGYVADEVIGRQPKLLKSGHTSEAEYRELWRTITDGSVWRGRFCNRRKDGSLYWESAIISPIRNSRGQVTHFAGINDDITARVEAEAALRDSEARFRRLFDLAPVPLVHVGRNGVVIDVNQRFVETFGYTHEQVPTVDTWWQLAYPDREYRQQVVSTWEAAVELAASTDADIEPKEYWVTCRSGNIRTLVISGSLVGDSIIVIFFDVTERKQAELALAERDARHKAAIDTAADGFWIVDAAGRLLEVNDAYVRRSGYSREALMTMNIAQLDAQEAPEEVHAHVEMIQRQGNDLFETQHRTRSGELWPVEVNAAYWANAGGHYFVFLRDLTERQRNEAAMRALRLEMERLMRAHVARQTVAALAHELNQPLSAVTSYSEAALRLLGAGNPNPDKLRHALENGTLQAQRAGRVVRDLLALLQKGEIKTEAVDLNHLVSNALALVKADGHGDFRAVLELASELAPVRANRLQIEKVLVNLMQNAVEAMRDAGVEPKLITIAVRTASDTRMAHVTVRDSGPGLDEQTLQRIFDPFFTTKVSGLGMGLPISRAIVEAHGGRLWVEPIAGTGVSVHFTLPYAR